MQVGIDPQQLGLQLGSGAVIGGIIGFAAKKIAKLIAVIVGLELALFNGLELALFKFLESRGILSVDWEKLSAGLLKTGRAAGNGTPPSWITTLLSTLSVSAGFVGGFVIGFRKG